jgi:hypothetical protein
MKNFKSLLLAVAVAAGALFTSCTEDAATTVTIKFDAASFTAPAAVTGTITAAGVLKSVSLLKDSANSSSTVSGWPKTTFTTGNPIVGADGNYTVRIQNLSAGSYTLSATDKNDVQSTQKFTVLAAAVVVTPVLTTLRSATTIYCTLGDGSNKSTCASADGSTYAAATATSAQKKTVDFVYFNASGTSFGIYSPAAVPTACTTIVAWASADKNTTLFAKNTTLDFATATYAQVKAAADAIATTATTVTGLAATSPNNVVVFKTAAGKVGIFKVNSITTGFLATDNVNINIKVQN